jgi:hypothetical protein
MKMPWFGPTDEEIEAVVRHLIRQHGANAPDEALRICDAYRSLRASRNERLYRLAARRSAVTLARAREAASWRFPDQAMPERP